MRDLLQDIRFALRTLAKTPVFSLIAVITIALGIGANTAAFSMVNGVLLRRLPYRANDRLIRIKQPSATSPDSRFSVPEIKDYRAQVKSLSAVAEYHSMAFQWFGDGEPQRVQTGVVSDNFFDLLGVQALIGRTFRPGEDPVDAPPVVVISYRYWMQKLGGDPKILGRTFTMNNKVHTVVGVLPPLPAYPDENDIWLAAGACPFRAGVIDNRRGRLVQMFGVLAPGATIAQAKSDIATVSARLHSEFAEAYPAARKLATQVVPLREELTAQSRPLFLTLLGAAAFVLLIAMTNFANLMLARQLRRRREIALRQALGAGKSRLFRQLVTESLCVSVAGGVVGIAIAYSGLGLLRSLASRVTPRAAEISIDTNVLAVRARDEHLRRVDRRDRAAVAVGRFTLRHAARRFDDRHRDPRRWPPAQCARGCSGRDRVRAARRRRAHGAQSRESRARRRRLRDDECHVGARRSRLDALCQSRGDHRSDAARHQLRRPIAGEAHVADGRAVRCAVQQHSAQSRDAVPGAVSGARAGRRRRTACPKRTSPSSRRTTSRPSAFRCDAARPSPMRRATRRRRRSS